MSKSKKTVHRRKVCSTEFQESSGHREAESFLVPFSSKPLPEISSNNTHCLNYRVWKIFLLCFLSSLVYVVLGPLLYSENKDIVEGIEELASRIGVSKEAVVSTNGCGIPPLEPFFDKPSFSKDTKDEQVEGVNCVQRSTHFDEPVFIQVQGEWKLRKVQEIDSDCCYRAFSGHVDDCNPITENITDVPHTKDFQFLHLICRGEQFYRDGFAFIFNPDGAEKSEMFATGSTKTISGMERLNVIILRMENTHRMHFFRIMPKANDYLLKNLSAVLMRGYTKISDNSSKNLFPILTGKTVDEIQSLCLASSKLEDCPHIFNEFSAEGYKTGYATDDFNLSRTPFETHATDFDIGGFSEYMEDQMGHGGENLCYGTRYSFEFLLDNVQNVAATLGNRSYFQFASTTKLSRSDVNTLGDEALVNFLRNMERGGHLRHTAIILLGDEGNVLKMEQSSDASKGNLQLNMPLLYLVLPKWIQNKYPTAHRHLVENSDKLTSPFDLYETLKQLMDLKSLTLPNENLHNISSKPGTVRSLSLFSAIPNNRTCSDAGIPLHWCICKGARDEAPAQIDYPAVQYAVKLSIAYINQQLVSVKEKCHELELHELISAFVLNYPTVEDKGYRVYFKTSPGLAQFSSTVVAHSNRSMSVDEVVRLDPAEGGNCVDRYKSFCSCK